MIRGRFSLEWLEYAGLRVRQLSSLAKKKEIEGMIDEPVEEMADNVGLLLLVNEHLLGCRRDKNSC